MNDDPIEQWHRIATSQDAGQLDAFLDENAVFHSPIVHTPQQGKALVTRYLSAALRVFSNPTLRCVRKIVGPSDGVFEFEVEIEGVYVNVIDILKWNEAGRVVEFKVMVRPLKAIQLVQQKMMAMLQSSPGR